MYFDFDKDLMNYASYPVCDPVPPCCEQVVRSILPCDPVPPCCEQVVRSILPCDPVPPSCEQVVRSSWVKKTLMVVLCPLEGARGVLAVRHRSQRAFI